MQVMKWDGGWTYMLHWLDFSLIKDLSQKDPRPGGIVSGETDIPLTDASIR